MPFNSFAELDNGTFGGRAPVWFAFGDTRPLTCFTGIWIRWTSAWKVEDGETTNDVFAFLTINPNADVEAFHPKAMPVILRTPEEVDTWLTAPTAEALKLQRPLPDGTLRIVAHGTEEDGGARAAAPAGQILCQTKTGGRPELLLDGVNDPGLPCPKIQLLVPGAREE